MTSLIYVLGIFVLPLAVILYVLRRYESFFEPQISISTNVGHSVQQSLSDKDADEDQWQREEHKVKLANPTVVAARRVPHRRKRKIGDEGGDK